MNDDEILMRGGTEEDIVKYAEENGATDPRSDLEIIRAACVAANPEKNWVHEHESDPAGDWNEPIRLADVLLAIREQKSFMEATDAIAALVLHRDSPYRWNLRADDLEQQSPETLEFVANLLK